MRTWIVLIFCIVLSSIGNIYAQRKAYIYPPFCDSLSYESLFSLDSTFVKIECAILSDSVRTVYVKSDLVDFESVAGWIIIYSFWDQDSCSDVIKLSGIDQKICLSDFDNGYEMYLDRADSSLVKGVYTRRRPIAIINSFTCDVYYLERIDLFKLLVWDEENFNFEH